MRTLKFCAWDEKQKKMISPFSIENLVLNYNCEYGDSDEELSEYNFDTQKDGFPIFMQYTGLLDKNGKEIYDGDIVNAVANEGYEDCSIVSDVIFGNDYQWQVRSVKESTHGLPINWGGWKSIEVIGSIYENPNLLK